LYTYADSPRKEKDERANTKRQFNRALASKERDCIIDKRVQEKSTGRCQREKPQLECDLDTHEVLDATSDILLQSVQCAYPVDLNHSRGRAKVPESLSMINLIWGSA